MGSTPRLLAGIGEAMHHLSDRQRVLARNIANSDTPGYKARELEAPDFSGLVADETSSPHVARPQVQLTGTMTALGATPPPDGRIIDDTNVSEVKPDGNNVTLEDQLLKMGQIQADYATLTNLYRKQIDLLKTALGRGGSS